MPTVEVSEAERPLCGAVMPHSVGVAQRHNPSLKRAQVCRYRSGWGHYRTGVPVDSEIRSSTGSGLLRNYHFAFASLGFAACKASILRYTCPVSGETDVGRGSNAPAFVMIRSEVSRWCTRP